MTHETGGVEEHAAAQLLIEELQRTAFSPGGIYAPPRVLGDLRVAAELAKRGEKEVLL